MLYYAAIVLSNISFALSLEVLSRSDRGATNTKEIVRLLSWSHEARQELLDVRVLLLWRNEDLYMNISAVVET